MTKKEANLEQVLEPTKNRLRKDKTKVVEEFYKGNDKVAYTRFQYARVYKGYNILENIMFVRSYIQKKYEIDFRLMEQILFLTPKSFFTFDDFKEVAKFNFAYKRITRLIELGFVAVASKGRSLSENIYTATAKARKLNQEFHEMLAGETEIPTIDLEKSDYKTDNLKAEIIKKLNKKEKPKTVQVLWARVKK